MAAHQVNITDRANGEYFDLKTGERINLSTGRPYGRRLRPCAAQRSLGRSITLMVDAYEFMKGHRLKAGFAAELRRAARSLDAQALKVHEMVTGIKQGGK